MKWLRMPEVEDRTGFKRSQIYEFIKQQKFPKPHKLGKASFWVEDELTAWQRAMLAQGEAAA